MRKKERETTLERAYEILDQSPYVTLSAIDEEGKPYAVMLSPIRVNDTMYFHCAIAGKKLDCIQMHPKVCISAVSSMQLAPQFTTVDYSSCVVDGNASIVEDDNEKHEALYQICVRYSPEFLDEIHKKIDSILSKLCIVKVNINTITGKENPILRK